jgi:hypothetical protein
LITRGWAASGLATARRTEPILSGAGAPTKLTWIPAILRQPGGQVGAACHWGPEWPDPECLAAERALRQQQVPDLRQQLMPQVDWLEARKENACAGASEASVAKSVQRVITRRQT